MEKEKMLNEFEKALFSVDTKITYFRNGDKLAFEQPFLVKLVKLYNNSFDKNIAYDIENLILDNDEKYVKKLSDLVLQLQDPDWSFAFLYEIIRQRINYIDINEHLDIIIGSGNLELNNLVSKLISKNKTYSKNIKNNR